MVSLQAMPMVCHVYLAVSDHPGDQEQDVQTTSFYVGRIQALTLTAEQLWTAT